MAKNRKKVKLSTRDRARRRVRKKVLGTDERPRLSVFRSSQHTYAQVISDKTRATLVSASTREKEFAEALEKLSESPASNDSRSSKSVTAAFVVGQMIADRAKAKGLDSVVFDRNGYLFHGRVRAVAEGARNGGLSF